MEDLEHQRHAAHPSLRSRTNCTEGGSVAADVVFSGLLFRFDLDSTTHTPKYSPLKTQRGADSALTTGYTATFVVPVLRLLVSFSQIDIKRKHYTRPAS